MLESLQQTRMINSSLKASNWINSSSHFASLTILSATHAWISRKNGLSSWTVTDFSRFGIDVESIGYWTTKILSPPRKQISKQTRTFEFFFIHTHAAAFVFQAFARCRLYLESGNILVDRDQTHTNTQACLFSWTSKIFLLVNYEAFHQHFS